MHKKYLVRRFILYFLSIILPCLLFGAAYFGYTNQSIREQIDENVMVSLTSIRDNVQLVLDSATYQQELLTTNPRLVLSMQKLFNQQRMAYEDSVILNTINAIFSSAVNTKLYIISAYFYLDGSERFLSTAEGLVSMDGFSDEHWLDIYRTSGDGRSMWLIKRPFRQSSLLPETEIITVFLRMKSISGVIAVNINPERFGVILDGAQAYDGQLLYILDQAQTVLFANAQGTQALADYGESLLGELPAASQRISAGGDTFFYNALSLDKYQITLVSFLHENNIYQMPNQFISLFLLLTAVFTVLVGGLAYTITRRNFRQIYSILDAFEHGDSHADSTRHSGVLQNEYDVILHNIVHMYVHSNELKLEQKSAEMAALQMQINPHFLFNTLQTLDLEALSLLGYPNNISAVVSELSSILQYAMAASDAPVTLADEISHLKAYANIQAYRYVDKFTLHYAIDPAALSAPIFRLTLQPLVENSLYHGIKPLAGRGAIWIKADAEAGGLRFRVIDNGVGMDTDALASLRIRISTDSHTSIGLANVNRRLLLHYGPESTLRIASWPGRGTVVGFWLPWQEGGKGPA